MNKLIISLKSQLFTQIRVFINHNIQNYYIFIQTNLDVKLYKM